MTALVGTARLARLILRQERIKLLIWLAALGVVPPTTAQAFLELYPTEESRHGLAATVGANPAFSAILGPLQGTSIGALTAWRLVVIIGVLVGVMSVLTVVRHTRLEEETGRRELLGATVVGRYAPLAAAVLVTGGAAIAAGLFQTTGLMAVGLEIPGSVAFGSTTAGMGLFFTGVAAVAAQLNPSAGVTRGIGLAVLGALFLTRVVADSVGIEALGWVSPFRWSLKLSPFADETWWVISLWIIGFLVLGSLALALSSRRDVGEGLFARRPGPARGSQALGSPLGLAWRQHRAGLLGWSVGVSVMGLVMGAFADSIGGLIADSPQMAAVLTMLGGVDGITDAFFLAIVGVVAIIVSGYAVRTVLRLQIEESLLRSEFVLSTSVTRAGLAGSHLLFAFGGPLLMLGLAGGIAGLVYGIAIGDPAAEALRIAAAALAQVPAVWVVAGATAALYGAVPGLTASAWAALIVFLLLGQLGPILRLPQWAMNLSPFTHVPSVPLEPFALPPFLALVIVAMGLTMVGTVSFRNRDIPQGV